MPLKGIPTHIKCSEISEGKEMEFRKLSQKMKSTFSI